ncbi:hypothetical protein [Pleurocapsa sp. PCC 7319]|uniref:hypothetical protein n=1 Tax=Pleurocapsa sp. PCC 7319 TaxID=118161 RepID=UPI00034A4405|nr:hypothetical protein [Pleurocapsa sp. PCC 7319]
MKKRKKTKVELLLEVLADGKWHWGEELAIKVGYRFGDAVYKARHDLNLEIKRVRIGLQNQYYLVPQ